MHPDGGFTGDASRTSVTDAGGAFTFDGVKPGLYRLTGHHRNYPVSVEKTITVKAGETAEVQADLVPGAALSGKIVDEDGDPIEGCSVQAVRSNRSPQQGSIFAQANADGEYSISNVAPGKYVVTALCQTPVFEPRPLSVGPSPPPSVAWPRLYYPGSTTPDPAQPVELTAGSERTGIDFKMTPRPVTHVHVNLAGSGLKGLPGLNWQLALLTGLPRGMGEGFRPIDTSKDSFDIPNVFAGSYMLVIGMPQTNGLASQGFAERVDVADRPVEITAALRPSYVIDGTVAMEDGVDPDQARELLSKIHIAIEPQFGMMRRFDIPVKPDGSFTLPVLFPSRIRLIGSRVFMKSASFGSRDLTDGLIDPAEAASGPRCALLPVRKWPRFRASPHPASWCRRFRSTPGSEVTVKTWGSTSRAGSALEISCRANMRSRLPQALSRRTMRKPRKPSRSTKARQPPSNCALRQTNSPNGKLNTLPPGTTPRPQNWPLLYLAVALTTLATLLLELSLTRIFSVVFYYHFAFLAISIALFGLGVGGVLSYLVAGWHGSLFRKLGIVSLITAGLVIVAVLFVLTRGAELGTLEFGLVYFTSALPFVGSGIVVSLVISETIERVDRVYFFDLLGAAGGCLALVLLLNTFGGPNTVLAVSVFFTAAAGIWFSLAGVKLGRMASVFASLLLTMAIIANTKYSFLEVRYAKGLKLHNETFTKWNSLSRIGMARDGSGEMIYIDADASTGIANFDFNHLSAIDLGYLLHQGPSLPYNLLPGAKTLSYRSRRGLGISPAHSHPAAMT